MLNIAVNTEHRHRKTTSIVSSIRKLAICLVAACSTTACCLAFTGQVQKPDLSSLTDPLFKDPYVDVDEWRDKPVRHHYIHGGFKGTDARFSFYFPSKEEYKGRFFQHITPVPLSENSAQEISPDNHRIAFAIASGAYFVESNEGDRKSVV